MPNQDPQRSPRLGDEHVQQHIGHVGDALSERGVSTFQRAWHLGTLLVEGSTYVLTRQPLPDELRQDLDTAWRDLREHGKPIAIAVTGLLIVLALRELAELHQQSTNENTGAPDRIVDANQ